MDNSGLLVQAASGLERMMYSNQSGPLKDSTVAQVSAFVYYEAAVISKLTTSAKFKELFTKTIFDQINTDFVRFKLGISDYDAVDVDEVLK